YDANGNTLNNGQHSFQYDSRNRLLSVDNGDAAYGYNALSQRIRKELKGNAADVNGDGVVNHLDITAANGKDAVEIDCNGDGNPGNSDNGSGKSQGNGNAKGKDISCIAKQIGANPNSPNTQTDANGGSGNQIVYFAYDQAGQLIAEYDDNGVPIRETVYLNNIPVAVIYEGVVYTVHSDHLNTPRAISNPQGGLVWRWEGEPFGVTPADEDPDGDGVEFIYHGRFPGQYYDAETQLHYNYFRYYDPNKGRYGTSDPIGIDGGQNTYTYVGNNPMSWIDPYGLCKEDVENVRNWIAENIGIEQSKNWKFGDASGGGEYPGAGAYYDWGLFSDTTIVDRQFEPELDAGDMQKLVNILVHEALHKKHFIRDQWESTWDRNWQVNQKKPYNKETHDLLDPVLQKGIPIPDPVPQCKCDVPQ
ncbi:MAG: hypothetical protein AMJ53_17300, partial [Gammaproteobacteria bacterium SG8_11]